MNKKTVNPKNIVFPFLKRFKKKKRARFKQKNMLLTSIEDYFVEDYF